MATASPNPRASLLAGLRTGGVRSASGPMSNVPHTAAPTGSFNVPRYTPPSQNEFMYSDEDEDIVVDMASQNVYYKPHVSRMQQSMTAAVDGSANRFAQQQTMNMNMNAGVPMSPFMTPQAQLQAMQMQMMQVEIARLQALQAQQFQAELVAQAQRQQQIQQRRVTTGFVPPATAGPTTTSFNARQTAMSPHLRRLQQSAQMREQVPMTADLSGKFGSRIISSYSEEDFTSARNIAMANHTTVISGGTSLGGNAITAAAPTATTPSKADSSTSWRNSGNRSVLGGNRTPSAPVVRITPPPTERSSPPLDRSSPPLPSPSRTRPQPLHFSTVASQPLHSVVISDGMDGDDSSSVSSRSNSSPSTPRTASSIADMPPPLSPREEASKKLYEGLGIGRPVPAVTVVAPPAAIVNRMASHPTRQPRGPPSNHDELVPKNFASRSRRKAIGALLDARDRREVVEVL